MFNWLIDFISIERSIIIGAIFTLMVILGIFAGYLVLRKRNDNNKIKIFLYSVLFGISIIMSILGMYSFARQRITSYYVTHRQIEDPFTSAHLVGSEIVIAFVIFSTIIMGTASIFIFSNYLFKRNHDRDKKNLKRNKFISFSEQVIRRIPIGVIGTLATNPGKTIHGESGLMVIILIYAFFDTMLIYLEFREKYNVSKTIIFSLGGILIHYPLIVLDAVLSNIMIDEFWWKPFVLISLGSIYIFNAILKYLRGILKTITIKHEHYEFTEHDNKNATQQITKVDNKNKLFNYLIMGTILTSMVTAILLITI
ncbi:MAG: hypothetical protein HRT99_01250 [Mycoplasmatales bacterium]|nr:hypothetical protein [Mycoplasmatales bacterium]